jgi:hypothetical protein
MSTKPAQTISAFGAMLSVVLVKAEVLVIAIEDRDEAVPRLTQQFRGALDVIEAGMGDVRRALDAVDGGG